MSDVYTGLADFGRVYSTIGLIIGIVVGVAFIIAGVVVLVHKPKQDDLAPPPPKRSGWIPIAVGVLVVFLSWLIWHFAQKSKAFAAAEGVAGGISLLESAFK
jgi:uncharacterized membrane protein